MLPEMELFQYIYKTADMGCQGIDTVEEHAESACARSSGASGRSTGPSATRRTATSAGGAIRPRAWGPWRAYPPNG